MVEVSNEGGYMHNKKQSIFNSLLMAITFWKNYA